MGMGINDKYWVGHGRSSLRQNGPTSEEAISPNAGEVMGHDGRDTMAYRTNVARLFPQPWSRWKETGGQRVENVAVGHIVADLLGCVKRLHERMCLWLRLVRNCATSGSNVA